jgi:hypothetical protein
MNNFNHGLFLVESFNIKDYFYILDSCRLWDILNDKAYQLTNQSLDDVQKGKVSCYCQNSPQMRLKAFIEDIISGECPWCRYDPTTSGKCFKCETVKSSRLKEVSHDVYRERYIE